MARTFDLVRFFRSFDFVDNAAVAGRLKTPAKRRVSASGAVNQQLRWPFARGHGDLPLPKPVRSAILVSKRPGTWQMSVQVIESTAYPHEQEGLGFHHRYLLPSVLQLLGAPDNREIFEIGFGNGAVANFLFQRGFQVSGIEPSSQGVALAHAAYPHLSGLAQASVYEATPERFGTFPVVLSLEVIEHLYSPNKFTAACYSLLKPSGVLIISTPYHSYLKNLAIAIAGKSDQHYNPLQEHGHIKFWSVRTLTKLLVKTGFTDLRFSRVGRIPPFAKSMIATGYKPLC